MSYNTLPEKTLDDSPPSVFKAILFFIIVVFAGVSIAFLSADPTSYAETSYQKCESRADTLRNSREKEIYLKETCDKIPYEKNDRNFFH